MALALGFSLMSGAARAVEENIFRFNAIDPGDVSVEGRFSGAAVHLDIVGADAANALGGQSAIVSLDIDCPSNAIGVRALTIYAGAQGAGRATELTSREAWARFGGDAYLAQVSRAACDQAAQAAALTTTPDLTHDAVVAPWPRSARPYRVHIGFAPTMSAAQRQTRLAKRSVRNASKYVFLVRVLAPPGRRDYEITAGNFTSIPQARAFCAANSAITGRCLILR